MKDTAKCQIMFRLDDISPDMDRNKFERVKDIFFKNSIAPLIGVVPENRDNTLHIQDGNIVFWEEIIRLQEHGWKVAQHGTYHQYATDNSGILGINPFSEFAGLSYEAQYNILQTGKAILESHNICTDIFMAPGHTYDVNTLKALKACGFRTVTDGLYKQPYKYYGLLFIPCRLLGYKVNKGIETVCLHTNTMSEKDFCRLEDFCRKNADRIVSFEPDRYEGRAVTRTVPVMLYEKLALFGRRIKNKIANSGRLAWYMNYTNHNNRKIKMIKRIGYLPVLLFYRGDRS